MSLPQHGKLATDKELCENKSEDITSCILEKKVENKAESATAQDDKVNASIKDIDDKSSEKKCQQPISVTDYLAHLIPLSDKKKVNNQEKTSGATMPNKTAPSRRIPHLHKLEKKHSSGDLHSRLKTRKLLGVGETDDGDVHRSKLSQILGHSDQLYIKLPNGLRIWQIILSSILSVMAVWALVFPSHFFMFMYEMDGSGFTFPIRLYASALVCIAIMYWSTIQVSDRESIRLVLLSSVVFFALQSLILMTWFPWQSASPNASFMCSVMMFAARLLVLCVSSYFYWITYKDTKYKDVKYYR